MKEYKPFPRLAEIHERILALADRLDISTAQTAPQIWEMIGKALAHMEPEFKDFEFLAGYGKLGGKGRRKSRVNRDVILADQVHRHINANPGIGNVRAAVADMRAKGLLTTRTEQASQEQSVSRGLKTIRAQTAAWQMAQEEQHARDLETEKRAKATEHLRRRNRTVCEK